LTRRHRNGGILDEVEVLEYARSKKYHNNSKPRLGKKPAMNATTFFITPKL
jgi:hypothetical protein